jgi:hypothetical protein
LSSSKATTSTATERRPPLASKSAENRKFGLFFPPLEIWPFRDLC